MPRLFYPFSKPAADNYRRLVRGEGVRVYDDQGNAYIDGLASLWYNQVGYGRTEIVQAVADQLNELPAYNIFPPWSNNAAEAAAERILDVSPMPDGRVFLCCSGSESVDTALKLARAIPQMSGDPDRQILVRRTRGYHGVNMGGTSAQGIEPNRVGFGDLIPHMAEIDPDDIESAARLFSEKGSQIAAVICEPMQGAGGIFPPTEGYLEKLRELCTQHGALLIFDEVICGFGRTGSWFATDTYKVMPDLITFAKGVTSGYQPLGGVLVAKHVMDRIEADPEYMFRHGYTYSGHPGSSAAAVANINIIEREGLVERANEIGVRMEAGLNAMKGDGLVTSVRGVGAVWAAALAEGTEYARTVAIRDKMLDLGVVARPVGDSILWCPPLVISDEDIDICLDVMAEAVSAIPL